MPPNGRPPSLAAFPKFVVLITVKVQDKDHCIGVTKGTCQRGGNFQWFSSLLMTKVYFKNFAVRNPGSRDFKVTISWIPLRNNAKSRVPSINAIPNPAPIFLYNLQSPAKLQEISTEITLIYILSIYLNIKVATLSGK